MVTSRLACAAAVFGALGASPSSAAAKRPVEAKPAVEAKRPAPAKPTSESDLSAIKALIATYVQAADAADPQLAATVWANSPAVSFVYPKGEERGWEAIKKNIYEKMMGETFSERKLTVKGIAVHSYGSNAAWAEFEREFAARFRKDGVPLTARGRETQVYRKTKNRWQLVHVHYSAMPVAEERQGGF
jgi:uncharacterized protein (TIGR02246 family)